MKKEHFKFYERPCGADCPYEDEGVACEECDLGDIPLTRRGK